MSVVPIWYFIRNFPNNFITFKFTIDHAEDDEDDDDEEDKWIFSDHASKL